MSDLKLSGISGVISVAVSFGSFKADIPAPPVLAVIDEYYYWWFAGVLIGAALACVLIYNWGGKKNAPLRKFLFAIAIGVLCLVVFGGIFWAVRPNAENWWIIPELSYAATVASMAFVAAFGLPVLKELF